REGEGGEHANHVQVNQRVHVGAEGDQEAGCEAREDEDAVRVREPVAEGHELAPQGGGGGGGGGGATEGGGWGARGQWGARRGGGTRSPRFTNWLGRKRSWERSAASRGKPW